MKTNVGHLGNKQCVLRPVLKLKLGLIFHHKLPHSVINAHAEKQTTYSTDMIALEVQLFLSGSLSLCHFLALSASPPTLPPSLFFLCAPSARLTL